MWSTQEATSYFTGRWNCASAEIEFVTMNCVKMSLQGQSLVVVGKLFFLELQFFLQFGKSFLSEAVNKRGIHHLDDLGARGREIRNLVCIQRLLDFCSGAGIQIDRLVNMLLAIANVRVVNLFRVG